ncbi:MAG: phytanoyl-CoA dioxygenase family protein [Gammaproteobacteria bacterium]
MSRPVNLQQWQQDGYLILRGLFSPERCAAANALLDELWQQRTDLEHPITIDAWLESAQSRRMLFADAPDDARLSPYKINDLYRDFPAIRQLILDPSLSDVLRQLLDGNPLVCNSLNFEFGSQQASHIDTLYMPPRVDNKLVVSWIALDEVDDSNGPVQLYPGSHLIPPYRFSNGGIKAIGAEMDAFNNYIREQLQQRDIKPVPFTAEPGDVLIWHAQLLHGGSAITDADKTRRSLVTHYFRQQDYRHHFWRLRKEHPHGYYLHRRHAPPN